jgi:lactoylglutathione lyase
MAFLLLFIESKYVPAQLNRQIMGAPSVRNSSSGALCHFFPGVSHCYQRASPKLKLVKTWEAKVAAAIHSMIRVLDEDRSVEFYNKAFGLDVADRRDFDAFTLVYMSNAESEFELELTINKGRTEAYNLGDGYGHFAVSVSDLDGEHARISAFGFTTGKIVELNRDGDLLARFFFVTDPDGYKIEVLQRHGRYK